MCALATTECGQGTIFFLSEKPKRTSSRTGKKSFLIGKKMVEVAGIEPASLSAIR